MKKKGLIGRLKTLTGSILLNAVVLITAMMFPLTPAIAGSTASTSFTSASNGSVLLLYPGESMTYTVTGTFVGTVLIEKALDGTNYRSISISTANNSGGTFTGTAYADSPTQGRPIFYRFRCSAYTSGTAVTTLADVDDTVKTFTNFKGTANLVLNDDSVTVPGTLTVTGGIAAASISAGSLDTTKLAPSSVDTTKINADAVTTVKILAGNVDTGKLKDGAVTNTKIADASVDTAKLGAASVTSVKIASGAIDSSKLGVTANHAGSVACIKAGTNGAVGTCGGAFNASDGTCASCN